MNVPAFYPTLTSGQLAGPESEGYSIREMESLSPAQKEAFNRSVLLHEGAELKAAQKPKDQLFRFGNHIRLDTV